VFTFLYALKLTDFANFGFCHFADGDLALGFRQPAEMATL